jgi:dynein assembly factor with WDR repeat domains 1
MENEEKLKIKIFPPELEIEKGNNEKIVIKIHENFSNESKSDKIFENLLAQNANLQEILEKYKNEIISSLNKLISASTINPNKEYHLEKTFQCHDLPLSKIYFNHKGNYFLTCSYDGNAILWNRKTGSKKYEIKNHANTINSAIFSRDDSLLLTGSFDNLSMLFDADNGIRIKTFEGHEGEIVEVNFDKEEKRFCTASMDLTSKIFDIETGQSIITLEGHEDVVFKASFNNESNRILTGSYDKTCKLFDINNGEILFNFKEHTKEISNCFFNPKDNNIIISTSMDGLSKIFDIRKGENSLKTFDDHLKKEILCSDISSNGKYFITGGGDNSINLYDLEKMENLQTLEGHAKEIYSLHFNYGNEPKKILSGDGVGQCRLWDIVTGECRQIIDSSEETEIISCIFNEENSDILTADVDNCVKLYTNQILVNY